MIESTIRQGYNSYTMERGRINDLGETKKVKVLLEFELESHYY